MTRNPSHAPLDFDRMSPVIKVLIAANAVLYLLSWLVAGDFNRIFGLVPARVLGDRWVWQIFTYMFLHGSLLHLLFNLLAIWMFGLPLESQWGHREFLKFYLICGVGAALFNVALAPHSQAPVIGASGAIYGLLVAFAMMYPDAVVYLYAFFPIKAKHMAVIFGLMEFFASAANSSPGVARFAHLGGLLIGYVYLRWWWVLKIKAQAFGRGVAEGRIVRSERRPASSKQPKGRGDTARTYEEEMAEVDRILDKILENGESSLTREEREALRRHHPKGEGHA
ncbi:MAG: rhomboid family intramembrane serine protease [Elusimicrobia bacterium]|nr:rhomboid family intramembrane serine protease [Elusimicrobiota bacterium]